MNPNGQRLPERCTLGNGYGCTGGKKEHAKEAIEKET